MDKNWEDFVQRENGGEMLNSTKNGNGCKNAKNGKIGFGGSSEYTASNGWLPVWGEGIRDWSGR
jgi:hypothetical protein